MEPTEYKTMYSVEDRHWWYVGMQRISLMLIERFYPRRTDLHILDAGCGTGAAMAYMAPFGKVVGMDFMDVALRFCQQRGLTELAQGSVVKLPFASGQFDLVTSFDVLCHQSVGDYRDTLEELGRVLKPGGRLFLRLPAYNWLRAHHDEVVHTARRFTAAELVQDLQAAKFTVEKRSYANALLFPLAVGKRLAERIRPPASDYSDIAPNPPWQDALLSRFLFAEAKWLGRANLPFGLTVLVVARKG
ncbi:MAG: class I SAM-dependent methyltransferase [Chloroflexi bacterium]|nr:class I SAM-dependent methyltransferase [Chloroflexota bacterium]